MRARESLPKAGNALQEVCVCVSVRVCVGEQCGSPCGAAVLKVFFFVRRGVAVVVAVVVA